MEESKPLAVDLKKSEEKQKSKSKKRADETVIFQTHTTRQSQWTYFHLVLFSTSSNEAPHDILTVKQRLSAALTRFLGVLGSAVQLDILHLDGKDVWVRVPKDSGNAFHEAISCWSESESMKYVVKGRNDWLVKLMPYNVEDLF